MIRKVVNAHRFDLDGLRWRINTRLDRCLHPVVSVDQEGLDNTGRDADSQDTDGEWPMLDQNVCY